MIDAITVLTLFGSLSIIIISVLKTLTDYRIKKRMIDLNLINQDTTEFLAQWRSADKQSTLKWGLIFLFIGIGFLVFDSLDLNKPLLLYGIISICFSLGLLVFYFISRKG